MPQKMPGLDPAIEEIARRIDYRLDLADVRAVRTETPLPIRIGKSALHCIVEGTQRIGLAQAGYPYPPELNPTDGEQTEPGADNL